MINKRIHIKRSFEIVAITICVLLAGGFRMFGNEGKTLEPGTIAHDESGTEMVFVHAGSFVVGIDREKLYDICEQQGESKIDRCADIVEEDTGATYTYIVELPSYWIDRFEVTTQDFSEHCMAGLNIVVDPCAEYFYTQLAEFPSDPLQPRVGVSWQQASTFCTTRGARLPTEAEWEYAASGPKKFIFPWGNLYDSTHIRLLGNALSTQELYPVGNIVENQSWVGAFDLTGNAAEWIEDRFLPRLLLQRKPSDFVRGGFYLETARVTKGGSSNAPFWSLTTFFRESQRYDTVNEHIGFRCARTLHPGE